MLYVVGKLFSKLEHMEISALCVYLKGYSKKKAKLQPKANSYKKVSSSQLSLTSANCCSVLVLANLTLS